MLKPSPSMRREWIEILLAIPYIPWTGSPSMRREWIEMLYTPISSNAPKVSLHAEGVD